MRIASLILLNLVFPWAWGWVVYALLTRVWPMTKAKPTAEDAQGRIPHDYQI